MAKINLDVGPAAAQALGADAPVNNVSLTVSDRVGMVRVRGVLTVNNPAASTPTVTASIARNAVAIAASTRTIIMVASERKAMVLEALVDAVAVGDVFTLRVATSAAVAAHELTANQSALEVEGVSPDAARCPGVGAVTA